MGFDEPRQLGRDFRFLHTRQALTDTLPPPGTDVSNEEVERHERQLELGEVAAVLLEEFVRRVQRERGR